MTNESGPNETEKAVIEESLKRLIRPLLWNLTSEGISRDLQESTVIQAATARLLFGGYDKPEFWKRKDVCARSTFMKWRKHDPEFVKVFNRALEKTRHFRSAKALDALDEAATILQLHTPEAAWTTIEIMRQGTSEDVQRRMASKDILQHASKETAEKGQDAVNVNLLNADNLAKFAELGQRADDELHQWRKQQETAVSKTEEE